MASFISGIEAMGPDRREISAEELTAVFRLASVYPDLRTVEADLRELADLRRRVKTGEAAIAEVRESQRALTKALVDLGLSKSRSGSR